MAMVNTEESFNLILLRSSQNWLIYRLVPSEALTHLKHLHVRHTEVKGSP